ncbi:Calmodulin [Zancudomyces culisetae]|uniref:Calmodulin n=1 Tax=Zancudomyces culisetae TaxID=1213189 RepID=A0A1R1PMX3_ZANCU|nr:Calmodulin [Zancudomyces culisetae]|eukprot:OMH82307.1 Calmodulin [Zancudomyces culisetae]
MPHGLSEKEVADYKEVFRLFDKENAGFITADGLGSVMGALQMSVPSRDELVRMIKANTNGQDKMNLDGFIAMITKRQDTVDDETRYTAAYEIFQDETNRISAGKLRAMLNGLGIELSEKDAAEMIHENDVSGDGSLSYEEFLKMLMTM